MHVRRQASDERWRGSECRSGLALCLCVNLQVVFYRSLLSVRNRKAASGSNYFTKHRKMKIAKNDKSILMISCRLASPVADCKKQRV